MVFPPFCHPKFQIFASQSILGTLAAIFPYSQTFPQNLTHSCGFNCHVPADSPVYTLRPGLASEVQIIVPNLCAPVPPGHSTCVPLAPETKHFQKLVRSSFYFPISKSLISVHQIQYLECDKSQHTDACTRVCTCTYREHARAASTSPPHSLLPTSCLLIPKITLPLLCAAVWTPQNRLGP